MASLPSASNPKLWGTQYNNYLLVEHNADGSHSNLSVDDIVAKGPRVDVRSFDAVGDGATDDIEKIQAAADSLTAGGVLYFPKTSSFYSVSTTIDIDTSDNVLLLFDKGAEIRITAASLDLINITKDHCGVVGATLEGEGTYVTTGSAGARLIYSSGEHTLVRDCYLKEAEQTFIKFEGAYGTAQDNTIEGGKFFVNAAAISTDRQYYGIWVFEADGCLIDGNKIQPNTVVSPGAGRPIEGIQISSGATPSELTRIVNNTIDSCYDHAIYAIMAGSVCSNNTVTNCGIKIEMPDTAGIDKLGNIVDGNNVSDAVDSVLSGDDGIALNQAVNCTVSNNVIRNVKDAGIVMGCDTVTTPTANNIIIGNIISKVSEGNGSNSYGIRFHGTNLFYNNVISGNNISEIGVDTGDANVGIRFQLEDTATNYGNIISGNTFDNIQEQAILGAHLTSSMITGNMIKNIGVGAGNTAIDVTDFQKCTISNNYFLGIGVQMTYAYEEAGSDFNLIKDNVIVNAATGFTNGLGTDSKAEGNWNGINKFQTTVAYSAGQVADTSFTSQDVTVTGAVLGDFCLVSFSADITDLQLTAIVTVADTATITFSNSTGGAVTPVGNLTVKVIPKE